jgi:signal transduction histidine kinase
MVDSGDGGAGDRPVSRDILDSLGEGVTLADREGRIVFSNRAADRILGVSATDAPADEWAGYYGIYLPDGSTTYPVEGYPLLRALRGEETDDVHMVVRNPQMPEGVTISVTGRPLLGADGTIEGAVVVFRDITRVQASERELRSAIDELRRAALFRDELTAFLVHDLKSPLSVIMSGAEALLDRADLGPTDREWLNDIHEAADGVHRMVLDFLDVQLATDGSMHLAVEPVAIDTLFRDVHRSMRRRAFLKDQTIELCGLSGQVVKGERDLLIRVLCNLVDNCVKYGPLGGTIRLEAVEGAEHAVRLQVSDQGPGVPADQRERIFDKYARVERTGPRDRESRGLGLRFCRVVAEEHGGRIWIEDNEPRGARFCLELPADGE